MVETIQALECRVLLAGVDSAAIVGLQSPTTFEANAESAAANAFAVSFETMRVGQLANSISVTVTEPDFQGDLDACIDWNGDGSFGGAAENVASHLALYPGVNTFQVDVPAWALSGNRTARLQFTSSDGVSVQSQDDQLMVQPPVFPSGDFAPANPIDSSAAVQFASTADLDRDGDLDILSATFDGSGMIAWYENDGNQGFTRHVMTTSAYDATSVLTADLNADGFLDVVVASLGNSSIVWYENDGHQQFTPHLILPFAWQVSSLFVADLDGDGDQDIIAASKGDNLISWYENQGNTTFQKHTISIQVSAPCAVFVADFDRDGQLDVGAASFSGNMISWFQNDGKQNFIRRIVSTATNGVRGMFVADFDNDGDQDIVSSSLYGNTIAWHENDGHGNFIDHNISSHASRAAAVYGADMDGDGDLDVLGASRGDTTIAWFENTGGSVFPMHTISTSVPEPRGIIAVDLDGDGDLDVVSSSQYGNRLAWYENRPNYTPLTGTLESDSPNVTANTAIPVVVRFVRSVSGMTSASLQVVNGTVTDFAGSGSTYTFNVIADGEGTVTIMLPAGCVTDTDSISNLAASLTRELTLVPPTLEFNGAPVTYVRNSQPALLLPDVTVSGSRIGGGTLVIVIDAGHSRRVQFDLIGDTGLSGLGVESRTVASGKTIVKVALNSDTTADEIQSALRTLTFSTSQAGLSSRTRPVRIQLTDNSAISRHEIVQTIQIRRSNPQHSRRSHPSR